MSPDSNPPRSKATVVPVARLQDKFPELPEYDNPMTYHSGAEFRSEGELIHQTITENAHNKDPSRHKFDEYDAVLRAGPKEKICFDPPTVNAAIVTTGGLCPGLNSVIEEVVRCMKVNYGAGTIYGIRYGFRGFGGDEYEPLELTTLNTLNIHIKGGTILGTCRGHFNEDNIMGFIESKSISQVYVIGGDGSHRAALKINSLCEAKGTRCAVIGIPKTIDNDIPFFDKTFGFDTAVMEAAKYIDCAFTEASSVVNGVGLVKLMGRDAGFVCRNAALSSNVVNACLIPEIPFQLDGPDGLLQWLTDHLKANQNAVILMAESAGQDHMPIQGKDATGHNVYGDVGKWMKQTIEDHWKATGSEGKVFLFDPSYSIRSVPANSGDNALCIQLAQAAVHAAFAGYTGATVGMFHGLFAVLPIEKVVGNGAKPRRVKPNGTLWQAAAMRLSFHPYLDPKRQGALRKMQSM